MSNLYFDTYSSLSPFQLARSGALDTIFDAIIVGFDKLPSPTALAAGNTQYFVDTGAPNAYVVTMGALVTSYTAGLTILMKVGAANTNTGPSTVNVNGLGVKAIKQFNGDALQASAIPASGIVQMTYDGTDFRLISQSGAAAGLGTTAIVQIGQLGIGMSPTNILDITSSGNAANLASILNANAGAAAKSGWQAVNNTGAYVYTTVLGGGFTTDGVLTAGAGAVVANGNLALVALSGMIKFAASATAEAGRVGSDASLLWGTTTNGGWSGNSKFAAQSGASFDAASFYCSAASGQNAFRARVDNTAVNFAQFYYSTGAVGSITTNATNTAYNTSSDARLKKNIADADATAALAIIEALRVREWDWKLNDAHEAFGFVAQEEALIYPNAVTAGDDEAEIVRQWGRDDSKLVPVIVRVLQSVLTRLTAGGL